LAIILGYERSNSFSNLLIRENKRQLKDMIIVFDNKSYPNLQPHSVFIDQNAVGQIILKSNKPNSIDFAKSLGININQKITRKEVDIVYELDLFCESAGIKSKHNKSYIDDNNRYHIDYYLPEHKIAIEIDENNHSDRDPKYEKARQKYLSEKLGCSFIRCNPDDPKFTISGLIGRIHKAITECESDCESQ